MIGLIPAGGRGVRLGSEAGSKEIVPVLLPPDETSDAGHGVVSECLIRSFRTAGIGSAFVVLAPGKWDIPEHFGSRAAGVRLSYLIRHLPFGVPYTLDEAFPFVADRLVACGFPDILFQPGDAFVRLVSEQEESGADVVIGVFPVQEAAKWDAVVMDPTQQIERVVPKPHDESTGYTWILAVWMPAFSRFIHRYVQRTSADHARPETNLPEVSLGALMQEALDEGLHVATVVFENGRCLDVGTPQDLVRARREAWWK